MPTVYVNGRFLTQALTGVQRYAIELVTALDRRLQASPGRFSRIEVLSPRGARTRLSVQGVRVRAVGASSGHLWDQIDLPLHARDGVLVSLCNAGPLLHRRHIVAFHDAAIYANPGNFSAAYKTWHRLLRPLLGRTARRLVTVSAFSRGELSRYCRLPEDKFALVPNGADHILAHAAEPAVLAANGIRPGRYVLAVGSMSPNKNFPLVAEAFRLLGRDDLQLVVAGGANPKVFAEARLARMPDVVCLGHVANGELRSLYENALCFVFPSLYEGFGIPPLEAMCCGCPVVVSRAASLPEVCGDDALYCDPRDAGDLAAKILAIAGDPGLRRDLARRGRARAGRYRWDDSAEALLDLVEEVAGAPAARSAGVTP